MEVGAGSAMSEGLLGGWARRGRVVAYATLRVARGVGCWGEGSINEAEEDLDNTL